MTNTTMTATMFGFSARRPGPSIAATPAVAGRTLAPNPATDPRSTRRLTVADCPKSAPNRPGPSRRPRGRTSPLRR
jgi:hypothetical protein